jgi:hypothetical protein
MSRPRQAGMTHLALVDVEHDEKASDDADM